MFGSRRQLNNCNTSKINIAGDNIKTETCIRFVGAILDETLSFKENIKSNVNAAQLQVG